MVNAADPSNKVSVNYVYGLSGEYVEHADKVNILFTGNGENLDVRSVSAIEHSDENASALKTTPSSGNSTAR